MKEHAQPTSTVPQFKSLNLIGGISLLGSALLMVFAMLHHPTGHSHNLEEFAHRVESILSVNHAVHGGGIALMGFLVLGFSCFSTSLGWMRPTVRAAMFAYTLGALSMVTAALVSGFIVPQYLEGAAHRGSLDDSIVVEILSLLREINRTADQLGVVTMSAAVLLWSWPLLTGNNREQVSGIVGAATGAAGITGFLSGHLAATVHGVILFSILQGVWTIVIGVQLLRNRWPRELIDLDVNP